MTAGAAVVDVVLVSGCRPETPALRPLRPVRRRRRRGRGVRGLAMARRVRVDPRHDEDGDEHQHRRHGSQRGAQAPRAVVDAVHRPVVAPAHERGGRGLGRLLVVERHRLGGVHDGRWRDRGHHRPSGLGQAYVGRTRDPECGRGIARARVVVPVLRSVRGMRPHLLESVQLPVVVLDRVFVVVGAAAEEGGREHPHDDQDGDYPTYQHRPIFNRIAEPQNTAVTAPDRGDHERPQCDQGYPRPAPPQRASRGLMSSGMSLRRGLLWSRPERIGSGTPQSAPTAGSSQANPSSSSGS